MAKTCVIAAAVALAVTLAPAVHADPGYDPSYDATDPDQHFEHLLDKNGVLFDFPLEKHEAKNVCRWLGEGYSLRAVANQLAENGGYTSDEAWEIMSSSIIAYCREFVPPRH